MNTFPHFEVRNVGIGTFSSVSFNIGISAIPLKPTAPGGYTA
jgi:hypothetical protein